MKIYRGRLAGSSWNDAVVEVWSQEPAILDFFDGVDGQYATDRTKLIGPLTHHSKHSPSGFSWGYAGSGPSELARCILIDHLDDKGRCGRCGGQGDVPLFDVIDANDELVDTVDETEARAAFKSGAKLRGTNRRGTCPACYGEKTSFPPGLYQAFKEAFVVAWATDWEITSEEIDTWLATQPATV